MEENYTLAHKSLMKVIDNLPAGEIKDEYMKLMALVMEMVQNKDLETNEEEEISIMPFPV